MRRNAQNGSQSDLNTLFLLVAVCQLFFVSGHPNMGGPMQRMTPPRGMVPLGPQVQAQMICWNIYEALVVIGAQCCE